MIIQHEAIGNLGIIKGITMYFCTENGADDVTMGLIEKAFYRVFHYIENSKSTEVEPCYDD
jgi:hypothetical protein